MLDPDHSIQNQKGNKTMMTYIVELIRDHKGNTFMRSHRGDFQRVHHLLSHRIAGITQVQASNSLEAYKLARPRFFR